MQRVIEPNTPEYIKPAVARLSILVACACVLQVAESLLPHPLPGVRLGLANVVTLIALVDIGFKDALKVAVLRTLIGSLILGTFLTPAFVLSLSGSLMSTFAMALFFKLSVSRVRIRFSLVGISIIGSLLHNLTQIFIVYLLFIRNKGILLLWPWLALSAVVMGTITGLVAIQVCRALESAATRETLGKLLINVSTPNGRFVSKESAVHTLKPEIKILFVLALAVAVIFVKDYIFYTGVFFLLTILTVLSGVDVTALLYNIRKISSFIVLSFLMPVLFTSFGKLFFSIGPINITEQGVMTGGIYAFRIVLLFFATSLLSLTTSPRTMARGFESILLPARIFGISSTKLAQLLCVSWSFFPVLWQYAHKSLRTLGKRRNILRSLIHFLGDFVFDLYVHADRIILSSSVTGVDPDIAKPVVLKKEQLSVSEKVVIP